MASFTKGGAASTPFGKNVFLRSTQDVKWESYTLSAASVPTETIDGFTQKVLQSGEVLAKIHSGDESVARLIPPAIVEVIKAKKLFGWQKSLAPKA